MKIAGVQLDIAIGQAAHNRARMLERLRETAAAGAALTVFPECAVAGYCFGTEEEARASAEPVPGPSTELFARGCAALGVHCIFGLLEADGERLFNSTVLVGPDGLVACYRKIHLPYFGADIYATPGDRPFAVHAAGNARIGMNICYDAAFPESSRTLALLGADLIVLPTNWARGAERVASTLTAARAMENAVYYMAVNRVGEERGFGFVGMSRICDPRGAVLASADGAEEAVLYAEIDPVRARNKHIVHDPGKNEVDRFADRRPEMYEPLVRPHGLTGPGRQRQPGAAGPDHNRG